MSASRVLSAGLTATIAVCATLVVPSLSDAARSSEMTKRISAKGDRIAPGARARSGSTVAAVLSSGGRHDFTVTLRDRHGAIVYASDRAREVTSVAKNTEIAGIPVPGEPVAQATPVVSRTARTPTVRRVPVGCDRLVSSLVRSAAADIPGRCTT